jgi:hypothetical protein
VITCWDSCLCRIRLNLVPAMFYLTSCMPRPTWPHRNSLWRNKCTGIETTNQSRYI